jgi:hypothetical protein
VESKLDFPNDGPFKVMSIDQHGNCILGSMDDEIPYVATAPMSKLSRFRETARGGQEYLPSDAIDIKALLTDPKKKMRSVGKMLGEHFGTQGQLPVDRMLGERIQVYWSTKRARGWWDGTILRYDPQRKTFSIRYDTKSKDGQSIYEEYLLSPARPQWRFMNS